MKKMLIACLSVGGLILSLAGSASFAQDLQATAVSDRIVIVRSPAGGEPQLVVKTEKGLVVFNTFWSEITARTFREGIANLLKRDDFAYTLNITDRLDMFGGNATYRDTVIIAQDTFLEKYEGKEEAVAAEIRQLIDMWRWKADVSRQRLEKHPADSAEAANERRWLNTCTQRADELERGFSLVLPDLLYHDRMTLHLGDLSLELIWIGKAGNYNGVTVVRIPEEKVAIIPGFIMHSQHLAPHPHSHYAELDVPRWIAVLEELLEGEQAVERVVCDISQVWTRERAKTHQEYIRRLWNRVSALEAAGQDLPQIQEQLSLDREFAFVKEMQAYKDGGDDWIRPQHRAHVRVFFLQHKTLASAIIVKTGLDKLSSSLANIRELRAGDSDLYFDEESFNAIGYHLLQKGNIPEAIDVFKLNVEIFPDSANVYDSLAEAYMKQGNKELAIHNYRKSLELNPENDNAREKLKTLEQE